MGRRRTEHERAQRREERRDDRREERFEETFGIYVDPIGYFQPSNPGRYSTHVVCGRCSDRYEMPTGMHLTWSKELGDLTFRAGPCPTCYFDDKVVAWGEPELARVESDDYQGWGGVGATPEIALFTFVEFIDLLESGELGVLDAAKRLRARGGQLTRVADWLESRPVSAAVAVGVMTTVASLVGPHVMNGDQAPAPERSQTTGYTDEQVAEIIDSVLAHYDAQGTEREHPRPLKRTP